MSDLEDLECHDDCMREHFLARIDELEATITGLNTEIRLRGERIAEQEAIIEGLVVERKLITDDYTTLKALLLAIRGDAQAAHWHEDIAAALGEQP